jgi:integrase
MLQPGFRFMKIITILGIKLVGLREILEARVGIGNGLVEFNPVRDARVLDGNDADTHAYTFPEVKKLMKVIAPPKEGEQDDWRHTMRAAFMIAMFTGMRMEEIKGLKWEAHERLDSRYCWNGAGRVLRQAVGRPGDVYNLGGGRANSISMLEANRANRADDRTEAGLALRG